MRKRYFWDKELEKFVEEPPKSSDLGKITLITDSMPDTWHPCDGKHYSSKAKFRDTTRRHGGIEVGTETQRDTREKNFDMNIKDDLERAFDGT